MYTKTYKEQWKDPNLRQEMENYVHDIGLDEFVAQVNSFLNDLPLTSGVWHLAKDLDWEDVMPEYSPWKDAYNKLSKKADMPSPVGGEL